MLIYLLFYLNNFMLCWSIMPECSDVVIMEKQQKQNKYSI